MNNIEIYQIYHVARCGSTLLTALLSNCEKCYSEPQWTVDYLFTNNLFNNELLQNCGSIVKMQSIATRAGFKPTGAKVFLYRPLAQYLYKMTEVTTDWIENRKELYGQFFSKIQGEELILEPENMMQLHTIFWASCVLEMQKYDDVLWIKSNDFFENKESVAKSVLSHFGKQGNPDMRFSEINVKSLNLNRSGQIQPFESYITESTEYVSSDRGIILTETALQNTQIYETVEWAKSNIPLDTTFYY